MLAKRHARSSQYLSWLLVAILGAVEGIYGRTQYLGDWISYLNVSRAVSALDLRGIFDPMWSPGYPILVALMRELFPHSAEGEWHAITLLNWLIFLAAYACWRFLIRRVWEFYEHHSKRPEGSLECSYSEPVAIWLTCCAFLSCTLCLERVSSVAPDLLIGTMFMLSSALVLSVAIQPALSRAAGLGLILGAGCWTKGVFVSFAIILLATLYFCLRRKGAVRPVLVAAAAYLLLYVPYVAGVSWSYGRFTLGASGPLNYAFHVNYMPHWMNWQGGSPEFGSPIHPTRQLLNDLPVFEFGSPFRTTYPPYNNLAYRYQGYKHFFSPRLQVLGIARTLYFLVTIVKSHPFMCALSFTLLVMSLKRDWRISLGRSARALWPLFLPSILCVATYLMVHVEDRYLSPFCMILSLLPLVATMEPRLKSRRILTTLLIATYTIGAITELFVSDGSTFKAAIRRESFQRDPQWKLAEELPFYGLQPGDAVAVIHDARPIYRCHWAYVSRLRIVAELGSVPWSIAPWDRTRFDRVGVEPGDEDYSLVFWNRLTPEERSGVIEAFRKTGARAILSLTKPDGEPSPGWQNIRGTRAWIFDFAAAENSAAAKLQ